MRISSAELGLPLSTLVGLLARNDAIAPAPLAALAAERLSREVVSLHMRPAVLRLATRGARRCKLSRNAYIEALIAAHLADGGPLVILRSKAPVRL